MRIDRWGLLLFVCFFQAIVVYGADPTGTIAGTVLDPSGSAVPGAKVVVTATATGLTRNATSAADGEIGRAHV